MFPLIFGVREFEHMLKPTPGEGNVPKKWASSNIYATVDGSEIRRSPVEIGRLSPLFTSVFDIPGGFCSGFFPINSSTHLLTALFFFCKALPIQ